MIRRSTAIGAVLAAALWPAAGHATAFGVRLGAGCEGRKNLAAYQKFARRPVQHIVDAFNQQSWPAYRSSIDYLSRCWKGVDADLTVSVPMLVQHGDGTLADGAAGKYDDIFQQIATTLLRDGHQNAFVRIGWEFNGKFQPWFAGKDPKSYVAYWRRIVKIMRSVPGQHFHFEWTNASGIQDFPSDQAYPGDDVVDVVGSDVYNDYWDPKYADPQVRWQWIQYRQWGLRWLQQFALAHHKPIAFPEWGTGTHAGGHNGGDDPVFVAGMAQWFKRTGALYQCYWDAKDSQSVYDTRISSGRMPKAAKVYRRMVAAGN